MTVEIQLTEDELADLLNHKTVLPVVQGNKVGAVYFDHDESRFVLSIVTEE